MQDDNVEVTEWVEGVRTVTFSTPTGMPDFIRRMVGVDVIRVAERQMVVWAGMHQFTVSSETNVLNITGGMRDEGGGGGGTGGGTQGGAGHRLRLQRGCFR